MIYGIAITNFYERAACAEQATEMRNPSNLNEPIVTELHFMFSDWLQDGQVARYTSRRRWTTCESSSVVQLKIIHHHV